MDTRAEQSLCWSCKENVATISYSVAHRTTWVCPRCRDWLVVRDELDQVLRDNMDLEAAGRVDEALQRLDAFVEAHAHQDHDLRFQRRIAHHRVMTLFDAGRYVEAEAACVSWGRMGFADAHEFVEHGFEMARTLRALQRPGEARAVLETALQHAKAPYLAIAEKLELLENLGNDDGLPPDPKWAALVQDVANAYGAELQAHASLGKTMRDLVEAIRDKLPRNLESDSRHG